MNEERLRSTGEGIVLGIDLDNTLVCYDGLFHSTAHEEALIDPAAPKSKERIRDSIRLLPAGTKFAPIKIMQNLDEVLIESFVMHNFRLYF